MARKPKPKPAAGQVVTVRMYKGLLGDCFLLRVVDGPKTSHILIDCGILQNVDGDKAKMQAVAADIAKDTGGRLDLLVVTHEHHDHISGFAHAQDVFFSDQLRIDNLWMAWTENEADPQARALDERFNKAKQAVALAAARAARMAAAGVPGADEALGGLQNFIGEVDLPGAPLGAAGKLTGRAVMKKLKEKVRASGQEPRFLEQYTVLDTPGPVGLRAHVLGPPRDDVRLFQDLPKTRPDGSHETYLDQRFRAYLDRRFDAASQLLGLAGTDDRPDGDCPFPPRYGFSEAEAQAGGDGGPRDWIKDRYYAGSDIQRVDAEWLGSAGALALKLDSDTNNTSLALAFELAGGKVLIFAADAQVGNWLSWHDKPYGDDPAVTAESLLRRAVFYKVGHHASHNATLSERGLELMTSGDLVAMIPVVEAVAKVQGRKGADGKPTGWKMPYPPLLARLLALTGGRVIRGDQAVDASLYPPGRLRTHPQDLWVEYDIVA